MKCGHCKDDHATVAEVRNCASADGITPTEQRPVPGEPGSKSAPDRHHDDRRAMFEKINMLGDRIHGGKYALEARGKGNDVVFYLVDKPNLGKWAGKTFVKQLIGAPGAFREERLSVAESIRVLTALAADEQGAKILFGKKTETCSECGSPLTNKKSRDRGIGPDCAKKLGWSDVA